MIDIGRIDNLSTVYKEKWAIVCVPGNLASSYKYVPELAPSPSLFKKYRNAYHKGCFNKVFFENVYVPQFLSEINTNAIALLHQLVKMSREKDIVLCCFCEDETLCHRSLIAGILLGLGADIQTDANYIKYFKQFRRMENTECDMLI